MLCSKVINGELEQIKGVTYSLPGFIGPYLDMLLSYSLKAGQQFDDHGTEIDFDRAGLLTCRDNHLYQSVIYLSPGEYHHFHSPADWLVTGRRHFPGILSYLDLDTSHIREYLNSSVANWLTVNWLLVI